MFTLFAQLTEQASDQVSIWAQTAPPLLIAVVAFALLRFVIKASLVVVVVGTIIALVASGLITFNL